MFQRHDTQRHNDRQPSARHRPAPSSDVFAGIRGLDEDGDEDEQDGAARIDNAELWRMQIEREQRSQAEACEKYCKVGDSLRFSFTKLEGEDPCDSPFFSEAEMNNFDMRVDVYVAATSCEVQYLGSDSFGQVVVRLS